MNFRLIFEATIWQLTQNDIRGHRADPKACMHAVRITKYGKAHRQFMRLWPEHAWEEELCTLSTSTVYAIIVAMDICFVCRKELMPLDVLDQWMAIHPEIQPPMELQP